MKKLNLLLGTTILFGSLVIQATSAFAETTSATSNSFIEFKEENGEIPPGIIDPDGDGEIEPETPKFPDEGGVTDQKGLLTIDYVPYFNFGTQTLSAIDQEYHAKALQILVNENEEMRNQFVQVTDRRSGAPGWTLTVDMDGGFVATVDTGESVFTHELEGVTLTLSNLRITGVNTELLPALETETITLGADQNSSTVMSASEGKGFGSYQTVVGKNIDIINEENTAATLFVPGKAVKYADVNYIGKIDWTLTDAPGNDL